MIIQAEAANAFTKWLKQLNKTPQEQLHEAEQKKNLNYMMRDWETDTS